MCTCSAAAIGVSGALVVAEGPAPSAVKKGLLDTDGAALRMDSAGAGPPVAGWEVEEGALMTSSQVGVRYARAKGIGSAGRKDGVREKNTSVECRRVPIQLPRLKLHPPSWTFCGVPMRNRQKHWPTSFFSSPAVGRPWLRAWPFAWPGTPAVRPPPDSQPTSPPLDQCLPATASMHSDRVICRRRPISAVLTCAHFYAASRLHKVIDLHRHLVDLRAASAPTRARAYL